MLSIYIWCKQFKARTQIKKIVIFMKTSRFICTAIVVLLTIGCSNNDDSISSEQLIVGNWIVADMSFSGNVTAIDTNIDWAWFFAPYPIPVDGTIVTQNYSTNFTKSNQITSTGSLKTSYVAHVNDFVNTYDYTRVIEDIQVFKDGSWFLNESFLSVNSNGITEKYPVIELSKNKLTILKQLKDPVLLNINDFGDVDCQTNLQLKLTFRKN